MRVTTAWAWISLGLLAVACGDEDPDPVVNEDIAWIVGCAGSDCGSSLTEHTQANDPKTPYEVSCSRSAGYFNLKLVDPGVTTDQAALDGELTARHRSELHVTNIDKSGNCNVKVVEQGYTESAPYPYQAECGRGCTVKVLAEQAGWDFVAEVLCDDLRSYGSKVDKNPAYTLSHPSSKERPVVVKLANCD